MLYIVALGALAAIWAVGNRRQREISELAPTASGTYTLYAPYDPLFTPQAMSLGEEMKRYAARNWRRDYTLKHLVEPHPQLGPLTQLNAPERPWSHYDDVYSTMAGF